MNLKDLKYYEAVLALIDSYGSEAQFARLYTKHYGTDPDEKTISYYRQAYVDQNGDDEESYSTDSSFC